MRYLVTGAAGFIGSHLCERLLQDGHEVVGVDNLVTGQRRNLEALAAHKQFSFLEQDISEALPVEGPVDGVYNFACPASPSDFRDRAVDILRVCSAGVLNGLRLAQECRALFIQASTSECYGDPQVHPQKESYWGHVNPIGHRSPYDEGKRFAEALVMAYHRRHGLRTRIGRIFNTYGPGMRQDDGRVLPNFIGQALAARPLTVYGDGGQTRSFCYVRDLVDGFVRLSHCQESGPINLGNDRETTVAALAQEVLALTGSRSQTTFEPLPQDDPKRRCPDLDRARQLLGWQPSTALRDGLQATIAYFRTVLKA